MVVGTINDIPFKEVLEPDGRGSHWFKVSKFLCKAAGADVGDRVELSLEPSKNWLEPEVPTDLKQALTDTPQVHSVWGNITPIARWDWVRWIRSTRNVETRMRRIETACSKLLEGTRRPCCFNRNLCTEPKVSKNGVLLSPTPADLK